MDETDALEDETYMIIGAIEVLNRLGHGIHEKPYENALMIELGLREIRCEQQTRFDVIYKTIKVGEDVPDLIGGRRSSSTSVTPSCSGKPRSYSLKTMGNQRSRDFS
jgi:hypothetical protein